MKIKKIVASVLAGAIALTSMITTGIVASAGDNDPYIKFVGNGKSYAFQTDWNASTAVVDGTTTYNIEVTNSAGYDDTFEACALNVYCPGGVTTMLGATLTDVLMDDVSLGITGEGVWNPYTWDGTVSNNVTAYQITLSADDMTAIGTVKNGSTVTFVIETEPFAGTADVWNDNGDGSYTYVKATSVPNDSGEGGLLSSLDITFDMLGIADKTHLKSLSLDIALDNADEWTNGAIGFPSTDTEKSWQTVSVSPTTTNYTVEPNGTLNGSIQVQIHYAPVNTVITVSNLEPTYMSFALNATDATFTVDGEAATTAEIGSTVTVVPTEKAGYVIDEVSVATATGSVELTDTDGVYTFTMPAEDITATVNYNKLYTITVDSTVELATVTVDPTEAIEGTKIAVTVADISAGYELDKVTATAATAGALEVAADNTFTMPAEAVTVSATFKKIVYNVTVDSAVENGAVEVDKATASIGDTITVTATPDTGYALKTITVDGTAIEGNTFTMGAADTEVSATFEKVIYNVTVDSAIENGTITVDKATASIGDTITVTATPADGYVLKTITVDGTAIDGNTFTMGAADAVVSATFEQNVFNVTIDSAIVNGTVTVDKATAAVGDTVTVTATPATGYTLGEITVNGTAIEGNSFTMTAADAVVSATFTKEVYNVTVDSEIVNGTVTVDKATASYGDTVKVTATPDDGFELSGDITVTTASGKGVELAADNSFTMPAESVTVTAAFISTAAEKYDITVAEAVNGTVKVSTTSTAAGAKVTITATPAEGYEVDTIKVAGATGEVTVTNNAFTMPEEEVTVTVTFKKSVYAVTVADGITGGTVTVDKATASMGDTITVTATPDDGYTLKEITVDGTAIEGNTFVMGAADAVVSATFEKAAYTVTVAADIENGTVTVDKATASMGDTITVTATPAEGYALKEITVDGKAIEGNTFVMGAANAVVSATFEKAAYTVTVAEGIAGGTVTVDKASANKGDTITVTATPDDGYALKEITVDGTAIEGNTFVMGAANAVVSATFEKSSTGFDKVEADFAPNTIVAQTAIQDNGLISKRFVVMVAEEDIVNKAAVEFTLTNGTLTVTYTTDKYYTSLVASGSVVTPTLGNVFLSLTISDIPDGITVSCSDVVLLGADEL